MAEDAPAAAQGPWAKYQQGPQPAGPWAKYGGAEPGPVAAPGDARERAAETVGPGFFERVWDGLSGKDVSRAGRFGMGMGDPIYGMGQILSRSPAVEMGNEYTGEIVKPDMEGLRKRVDTTIREREGEYQGREKAAGLSGGFSSEWARLLGNVASPPNLAVGAAGGAAMAPMGIAGRLGTSAAMGAASGAMEPVASGDFGTEKAKQAGFGAAGGLVGGAAGEAVGSVLGKAIAGNSPREVDKYLLDRYRSVVKPSRAGQSSESQLAGQDRRILTAVDQIIANKNDLRLTDAAGQEVRGALPRSLRQFSEAIDQTKGRIFAQYDAMASGAETAVSSQNAARARVGMNPVREPPVRVDLAPTIQKLREVATNPEVADLHRGLAVEAEQLARNFEARGFYSPKEAQDVIQNLNKTLSGFYRNPTHDTVSRASLLAPVAQTLREGLDQAIENGTGPGYQALRLQYGALRSIEKDVAGAVQREANKIPGGIGGIFLDSVASEQALHGVFTFNPKELLRAGTLRAAKAAQKYINDPNRAIDKLFQRAASRGSTPMPMREGAGAAASYGFPPLGAMGGGLAGAAAARPAMPYEYGAPRKPRPSVIGP